MKRPTPQQEKKERDREQMAKKAIIFDMDGLMVDTEPISRRAWDQVLAPYGREVDDALYRRMLGRRVDQSAQMVLEALELPISLHQLVVQKTAVFEAMRARGVPAMPGLLELQDEIRRRGLPWGVATSSPRRHALDTLQQLGLADACRVVVGGNEVKRGKPAPDIYELAARRIGVSAAACLALEDTATGCRAAVAAGMTAVAVPGYQMEPGAFDFVPYRFSSLHQVRRHLDQLLRIDD